MMNNPLANEHQILRVDYSPAAKDALLDTRFVDEETLRGEVLMSLAYDYTPYVPDINAVYHYDLLHVDNVMITAICKVRGFRRAEGVAGWFVGILTPAEYDQLASVDIEERDDLMLKMLDIQDTFVAQRWIAHY